MTSSYVGRFAPTPSGYLHFGSLVAAVASYLDARAVGGRWLVRMEDLDPPREVPGAQQAILETLERYGFEWDGAVERQSERFPAYAAVVEQLLRSGLAYACSCSRKQLEGFAGIYPGFCRDAGHAREDAAIRLRVPELEYRFVDRVQGEVRQHLGREVGDFVIQRRDGFYAYQLAVVLDDAWQGITDIVRGADLLDSTPRQLYLQELLGLSQPRYLHVPLIVQPDGHKLGKSGGLQLVGPRQQGHDMERLDGPTARAIGGSHGYSELCEEKPILTKPLRGRHQPRQPGVAPRLSFW